MFAPDRHPDDELLRLFAVGRLTERQGDEIEEHLADCEPCARRLDEIERQKTDPFLREMQAVRSVDRDAEPSGDFTSGVRLGCFRLEKRLGRGGMGEAWKAFDETAKRYVVLKFVPKDVQHVAAAMDAVLDSFQKVHALQHSHICPLYLLDNDPEHGFFLVMKFIDGLPLDVYRRQRGPLPFDEVIRILRDVADALDYAHEKKVVHRDVKPANIMVGDTDGVQLIDFGLADEIRATLSVDIPATKITGTRSFMATEQWTGQKQDARTDQYSLAVTAYELLAGRVPFSGTDTEVLKNAVLHDPPASIPDLPEHVNAALFRGLAKRREDRFESCAAFVEALAREAVPPRLPPPPPTVSVKPLLWKWIAPAIVVSILVLSVLGIYLVRQSLKSDAEADVAAVGKPVHEIDAPAAKAPDGDYERGLNDPGAIPAKPTNPPQIDGFEAVPTKEQAGPKTPPFYRPTPARNNELFRVVRVTVELDAKAIGRLIVKRGLSAEPLPGFRGTQFDSGTFRNALLFRGQNGMGRIVFPKGDTSLTPTPGNLSPQKISKPFGWDYWSAGGSYANRHGGLTRFGLKNSGDRAGVSLGKRGDLPCAITFEVADNDDNPPYLEIVLYQDFEKEIKVCTISCWGEKEKNGRLRMNAAYSHPFMEGGQTQIAEDTAVEKNAMLSQVFQLPPVVAGSVKAIKYGLWARHQSDRPTNWTGFDLTFLDVVGRFKADAGFTIDERGTVPVVGRVDPTGPAFRLSPGAEILSVNDQSGSAPKLRETLDALRFGDSVTVRIVPKGGGNSITCLFNAE